MSSFAQKLVLVLLLLALASLVLILILTRPWQDSLRSADMKMETEIPGSEQLQPDQAPSSEPEITEPAAPTPEEFDDPVEREAAIQRFAMVQKQLVGREITDERVLNAMRRVKRHLLVPEKYRNSAYLDSPLPIGHGQTISQPYIVALMTQLAQPDKNARVLDVGTGSGYQAAVLAELVPQVYSIEIICPLADSARERLEFLSYDNVEVRCGDGYEGWPEHAPFDVIIVAAAPDHIPQPLIDQLAPGGHLVIPVGRFFQELLVIEKQKDGSVTKRSVAPVAFVPMTRKRKERNE